MYKKPLLIFFGVIGFIILAVIGALLLWYFAFNTNTTIKGSGNLISEERSVSAFVNLTVNGNYNIIIKEGINEGVSISAEDNIIGKIKTINSGDTLFIEPDKTFPNVFGINLQNTQTITIVLTYKKLNSITINGSGSVQNNLSSRLRTDKLNLSINGSGNIKLDIFADELSSSITGSGKMELTGAVRIQKVNINGTGIYVANALESKETEVRLSSSSDAKVRADDKLDINILGNGNVTYYGSPEKLTQDITGNGTVRQQ